MSNRQEFVQVVRNFDGIGSFSLSSAQESIYTDQAIHPESTAYNLGGIVEIPGKIDIETLKASIQYSARKFDTLRLTISESDDGISQCIASSINLAIPTTTILDNCLERDAARSLALEFAEKPMNLTGESSLWGVHIVQVGESETWLVYRFHHIIADGFSVALIIRDICKTYDALVSGLKPNVLSDFTFASILDREEQYLRSARFSSDQLFWNRKFDLSNSTNIKERDYRPHHEKSKNISINIARSEYSLTEEVLARSQISMANFFIACLATVCSKVRQSDAISIGISSHNRTTTIEKAQGVGMISTVLPILVETGDELAIEQLCKDVSAQLRSVYRHRQFQFAQVDSTGRRGPSRTGTLYDVLFSHEKFHDSDDVQIDGRRVKVQKFESGYERAALAVYVRDYHSDEDIPVTVHFRRDQTYQIEAERFVIYLREIFALIAKRGALPSHQVPLICESERDQLLGEFNDTACSFEGQHLTLHELVEQHARQTPSATALVYGGQ
ncbi:condensation domain-containing protein, partial [Burkholderia cepacia]|uniref:condensation domain-containing protein n=1 Tax=Burkholderia cepacia TaxID=292 RepID=UPI002FDFD0F9